MRTVAFVSFKGGAGKSTAAMALASSLVASGRHVTMIDADENTPLLAWREKAREAELWSDACEVVRGDDMRSLQAAFTVATDRCSDVSIVDTRGGGSELNNAIVGNVDIVIVPTALTGLDIASALSTFEYAVRLVHDARLRTPVVLLVQRMPVGRLTVSQSQDLEALSTLPRCMPVLHARDAFASISKRGMLHLLLERTLANPRERLTASHLATAMGEADAVRADIERRVEGAV